MANWSLSQLLESLHKDIQIKLETSRKSYGHPGTMGDASEKVWLELLKKYLPERYRAEKAHVVDSKGAFSDQIDIVIFDRQYSPFIFNYQDQIIVPAESVYAVFEAKQSINADQVLYSQQKVKSVRDLFRTSLPIPHAGGVFPAKQLIPIYGGILTFESDWSPPLGSSFEKAAKTDLTGGLLNIGCVAAHGHFFFSEKSKSYEIKTGGKPATDFLFKLISQLQFSGTVPMIDILEYSKWLTPTKS